MSELTQEQIDQQEAAAAAANAAELKAAKAAQKEADKAAKAAEKKAKVDSVEAEKTAKADAIAAAKTAKEATRQPEQNGIRRPGPTGLCGRVWGLADSLSATLKQATPIANLLEAGIAEGLNPSNIRVEYARWKKFHGLAGRIALPKAEPEATAPAA